MVVTLALNMVIIIINNTPTYSETPIDMSRPARQSKKAPIGIVNFIYIYTYIDVYIYLFIGL